SLAVLPLDNLSSDPAQSYLGDGITDQLIAEIAHINSLRVTSRTSVLRYRAPESRPSLPEIGRQLDVEAILEGSFQTVADRIRINVRLIRVAGDSPVWAKSYEHRLVDFLNLQSRLAADIAAEVRSKLSLAPAPRPLSPLAFENYLKARYFLDRPTRESLAKSVEYFRASLALDSSFAAAHAGLAMAYNFHALFGYLPQPDALALSQQAARRALELNPALAEAHNALAESLKNRDWNWPAAQTHYQRAIALNPNDSLAHTWYAECLSRMGRHEEALTYAERARVLDPVSTISNTALGMLLYRARRYEASIAACDR
ncbi:tetratricopeptide repeat protein, partial [Nostoc sp. NIES-2111]